MRYQFFLTAAVVALAASHLSAADVDLSKLPPAAKKEGVTYAKDIRPLFEASCFGCHGEQRQRGGLRLDNLEAVLKGGENGKILTSGKSAQSPLVIAVARLDPETAMPRQNRGRGGGRRGPDGTNAGGQPQAQGDAAGRGRQGGPPAKNLTPEEVGLVRAWIDQGAK